MTNYNDGNWHIWNGGECPVHPETVVEVALTDYKPCIETAEQWFWDLDRTRIIAFRVIKEYREPREFWIDPDRQHVLTASANVNTLAYIHVREVLK